MQQSLLDTMLLTYWNGFWAWMIHYIPIIFAFTCLWAGLDFVFHRLPKFGR